jgi:hypothetical protein
MKEIVTKCNHCGADIIGANRLLTFNGEEIDLCSDQCRLKWWMIVADEAEAAGFEIHIISKPGEKRAEGSDIIPQTKLTMLPGK